ncbi:MAG: transcriptional repressor [Clostridiaceae bacterium]|nr:transcriptional repressor [Clostridiaceae bacterium]
MDIRLYLKEKNIKVTKGRVFILDVLEKSEAAISADYIFEKCRNEGGEIDLSTVYRTLELLEIKGILEKFDLGNGKYNYIIKGIGHNHTLQCELCHKCVEIDCPMVQIQEIIKSKTGFTLLEHDLKLRGICNDCRSKTNR